MRLILGENKQHLRSDCGRFHLPKFHGIDGPVYRLVDGTKGICTERGVGAKERCMRRAEEILAGTNGIGS